MSEKKETKQYREDMEKLIKTPGVDSVSTKAKYTFVFGRVLFYALYAFGATGFFNGFAGYLIDYLVATGIEYISMSTFGMMIIFLGVLITLRLIQRGVDGLFELQFGVIVKKKGKKRFWHR